MAKAKTPRQTDPDFMNASPLEADNLPAHLCLRGVARQTDRGQLDAENLHHAVILHNLGRRNAAPGPPNWTRTRVTQRHPRYDDPNPSPIVLRNSNRVAGRLCLPEWQPRPGSHP